MQIDNCGAHSEKLNEIYNGIMKQRSRTKEPITIYSINKLDTDIFQAYQTILQVAKDQGKDGGFIATTLNNFSKAIEVGNIDTSKLNEVAIEIARNTAESEKTVAPLMDEINPVNVAAAAAGLGLLDHAMEEAFNKNQKEIEAGNKEAILARDITEQSDNYILMKERLNPEGAKYGALANIYTSMSTGKELAQMEAMKIVKAFDLQKVLTDGKIDLDKVKQIFNEKHPNIDLNEVVRKKQARSLEKYQANPEAGPKTREESVANTLRNRRVQEFRAEYSKIMDSKHPENVKYLVEKYPDVAEDTFKSDKYLYERFGIGEKSGEVLKSRMETIGKVLGKKLEFVKEENDERVR